VAVAVFSWFASFSAKDHILFMWYGSRWRLMCSYNWIRIDNEAERDRVRDARAKAFHQWNVESERLRQEVGEQMRYNDLFIHALRTGATPPAAPTLHQLSLALLPDMPPQESFSLPLGVTVGVLLILLAAGVFRKRARSGASHQRGAVVCRNCGYDLRCSKGRCPECGTCVRDG
jgi:hypothetical protein